MYFATDSDRIIEAMDGAAPRPIDEVLRESYPDAVFDIAGRPHAPHDGYVCPLTGKLHRGGEYLFQDFSDERLDARSRSRLHVRFLDGQELIFDGTNRQLVAGRDECKAQAAEHDAHMVRHVGTLGQRDTFHLMLFAVFQGGNEWGPTYSHLFRTVSDGSAVIYKGGKELKCGVGRAYRIAATVKSHYTASYDGSGRRATYVLRPKVEREL